MKNNQKMLILVGIMITLLVLCVGFFSTNILSSEENPDISTEETLDLEEQEDETDTEEQDETDLEDQDETETEEDQLDVEDEIETAPSTNNNEDSSTNTETNTSTNTETSSTPSVTATEIYNALIEAELAGRAMGDMSEDAFMFYNLSDELVSDYMLQITQMMPGMDEIFIAKAQDGKVLDVKEVLEARIDVLRNEKAFYPDDMDAVDAAEIFVVGDYIMLYVSGDLESAPLALAVFEGLVK